MSKSNNNNVNLDKTKTPSKEQAKKKPNAGGKRPSGYEAKEKKPSAQWSETVALEQAHNDPEWYASIPELLASSAAVNFFNPLGGPTHWLNDINDIYDMDVLTKNHLLSTVPGVCRFKFCPVLGVSKDNTSPVNMAARNLYTFIHSVMAVGSSSYDPPDMMLYTMAAASAYMYLAWMRRLYGCLNLYTQLNKYLPDALLMAMGVNPANFRDKMMSLYNYICVYQNKLGSFAIPTSLHYFTRQMWMASNLYLDDPINKAQIYMFDPLYYWRYEEYEGAGKLVRENAGSFYDMNDIVALGDKLLGSFVASQDIYTMSGDVLHAFGDNGIFKIDILDPNYLITPAYVPEVLSQIHNATLFPGINRNFTEITQDTSTGLNGGAILCQPSVSIPYSETSAYYKSNRILSMPSDMPNPAEVMVATRLMAFTEYQKTGGVNGVPLTSCGTEILLQPQIFLTAWDEVEHNWTISTYETGPYALAISDTASLDTLKPILANLANYSVFNYHPLTMVVATDGESGPPIYIDFDVDNYTVVDEVMVDRMHTCALMSMFSVPVMGMFNTKTTK